MSDNLPKTIRRKTMQAVKSKNTSFEMHFFKEMRREGLYFRTNVKDLVGKPDFAIKKYKVAIFLDSCFWHACKRHSVIPKTNNKFWKEKFVRNKRNDARVTQWYKRRGWTIIRIWEHDINSNLGWCAKMTSKQIKHKIASLERNI